MLLLLYLVPNYCADIMTRKPIKSLISDLCSFFVKILLNHNQQLWKFYVFDNFAIRYNQSLNSNHNTPIAMLRNIRRILAVIVFLAISWLFVDFTGFAASHLGWLAKIQVVPAILSLNAIALIFLILLTAIFGRVYCSVICPLGIMQDAIARLRILFSGRKKRKVGVYKWHKAHNICRYTILTVFILLLALGSLNLIAAALAALIEPYSAYGRIATSFFAPVYDYFNNLLAAHSAQSGGYDFYVVNRVVSPLVTGIAGITVLVVGIFACLTGRDYCNTICPVGSLLGLLSRYSWLKPMIDTSKCTRCGACARHCKGNCINSKEHSIDYSRCVVCMDCINNCTQGAIKYTHRIKVKDAEVKPAATSAGKTDDGRRKFMAISGILVGAVAAKAADKVTDGGLTPLKERKDPVRKNGLAPAGAKGLDNLQSKCVACQLCVQNCPNGVLKTSTDLEHFMQPYMSYEDGYCSPECTRCSEICPAGAITPVDVATKSSTKIGTAVVDASICLSANGTDSCGNCSRHCPAGAISMIPVNENDEESPLMPVVDENICIGCGACEYHCPVGRLEWMDEDRPAIHVEGIHRHREI